MQESTAAVLTEEPVSPLAVEMRAISKAWPGVVANDAVRSYPVRKVENSCPGW